MAQLNEVNKTAPSPNAAPAPTVRPVEKPTTLKFTLTKKRKIILAAIGALLLILASFLVIWFTDLKYSVFGVFFNAQVEVVVADSKTLQPIEGAEVKIDNKVEKTDESGKATLSDITLGKQKLTITKEAYKNFERNEAIFIGVNKLEPVVLEGAGIAISFVVKNKITNDPLEGAKIEVNKNAAKTAKDGTVVLNVLPTGDVKAVAKISKNGFINSSLEFRVVQNIEPISTSLIPEGKNYFLSNRSGKINLYESYLDGTKQKVLLAATGNEESNTRINVSPNNKWVALLSTREAIKGSSGNFIPVLYILNPKDKSLLKISSQVTIQIVGWVGDSLIYFTSNGKYGSEGKTHIASYNMSSKKKVILLTTSGFISSPQIVGSNILYSLPDKSKEKYGLFITNVDGNNQKTVLKQTVYTFIKTSTSEFVFKTADTNKWYSYNTSNKQLKKLSSKPPGLKDRYFVPSPKNKYTAFAENRDGKNELYLASSQGKNEKKLTSIGSVSRPIRWVGNEYIIFRSSKTEETADYIIGRSGGTPIKIVDIYNAPTYPSY